MKRTMLLAGLMICLGASSAGTVDISVETSSAIRTSVFDALPGEPSPPALQPLQRKVRACLLAVRH